MNLKIDNYKNLKGLDINIDNNKINFIFGISGSGKSSIGDAIAQKDLIENVTINESVENIKILIDDKELGDNYSIYDLLSVEKLLLNNNDNNYVYGIIFDNDSKIKMLQEDFKNKVASLEEYRNRIIDYISKVEVLNKSLGGKITKNGDLPNSSKIVKLINAVEKADNKEIVKSIGVHGNWYLPWLKVGAGSKEFNDGICPFCKKSIDTKTVNDINMILSLDEKGFDAMFQDTSILTNLNISVPNYSKSEEITNLKNEIIDKLLLKEELLKIINYLNYYNNPDFNPSNIEKLAVSDKLINELPGIKEVIDNLNSSIGSIKKTLGDLKNETDKLISNNLKKLNSYLDRFGIKYNFSVSSYLNDSRSLSYSLYHKQDVKRDNRINGLSYGEKNIISLILFLLSAKDSFIIIDDPASSFDDYRRSEILELIYDICSDKTVLVLSHDHIFMKYAIFNKKNSKKLIDSGKDVSSIIHKYNDNTGTIISLENYNIGDIIVKNIDYGDFDVLKNHILKFIDNSMEYFRLIINLRLYYECIRNQDNENVYEYLSAIYHRIPAEEIEKKLSANGLVESELLNEIYEQTKIRLSSIPKDDYYNIDIRKLSMFEKILYYRDLVSDTVIKNSYNNVVHMNESLQTCLNPYKFNYFSPFVYDDLQQRN